MVIDVDKAAHLRTRRNWAIGSGVACLGAVVLSLMGVPVITEAMLTIFVIVFAMHAADDQQQLYDLELRQRE